MSSRRNTRFNSFDMIMRGVACSRLFVRLEIILDNKIIH